MKPCLNERRRRQINCGRATSSPAATPHHSNALELGFVSLDDVLEAGLGQIEPLIGPLHVLAVAVVFRHAPIKIFKRQEKPLFELAPHSYALPGLHGIDLYLDAADAMFGKRFTRLGGDAVENTVNAPRCRADVHDPRLALAVGQALAGRNDVDEFFSAYGYARENNGGILIAASDPSPANRLLEAADHEPTIIDGHHV